jgi:hypothetical protein
MPLSEEMEVANGREVQPISSSIITDIQANK